MATKMATKMADDSYRPRPSALEFYSGIGGMHFALRNMFGERLKVLASFDINTTVNTIYEHNFPNTTLLQRNLCGVTARELDTYGADIFVMSPPCQPFTRQGLRADCEDHRTDSFFNLMDQLSTMTHPPSYIFLENVQGFEESKTRQYLLKTLQNCNMDYREFLISPSQFQIPNSRLRYYLMARSKCKPNFLIPPAKDGRPYRDLSPFDSDQQQLMIWYPQTADKSNRLSHVVSSYKLHHFCALLAKDDFDCYKVPHPTLVRYLPAMDVVTGADDHSCCFTKGYGHYIVGTGSILQENPHCLLDQCYKEYQQVLKEALNKNPSTSQISDKSPHKEDALTKSPESTELTAKSSVGVCSNADLSKETATVKWDPSSVDLAIMEKLKDILVPLKLRYFTEREIANLHCLPDWFSFPQSLTLKQRYKALGNSLNVHVVTILMKHVLFDHINL